MIRTILDIPKQPLRYIALYLSNICVNRCEFAAKFYLRKSCNPVKKTFLNQPQISINHAGAKTQFGYFTAENAEYAEVLDVNMGRDQEYRRQSSLRSLRPPRLIGVEKTKPIRQLVTG